MDKELETLMQEMLQDTGNAAKLGAEMKIKAEKVMRSAQAKIKGQKLTDEQKKRMAEALKKKEKADKKLKDLLNRM